MLIFCMKNINFSDLLSFELRIEIVSKIIAIWSNCEDVVKLILEGWNSKASSADTKTF